MRPLLLALTLALPLAALAAGEPPADWRKEVKDERVKAGLTMGGWRLEDDGRALDPKTKTPATKAGLDKAVLDLRQDARRAALETVSIMIASGKPLETEDLKKIEMLSADLPDGLVAALLSPKPDLIKAKTLAEADLSRVAAYFDGSRTMADRQAAAQPVSAGTPGPRAAHPYYTAQENSVGDKLRNTSASVIGADPFGKVILSRLNGRNGQPDLPPVLIEDQSGSALAQYDIRRRAIVLDREGVVSSIVGAEPPARRAALRRAISTRAALLAYLDAHPEAVAAVARDADVVMAHELTHAWQDRRDPIFREMARGNIPAVQPLEYEEEAYKTKNLYIHSKIQHDPASVKMDEEFRDYFEMAHGPISWLKRKSGDINQSSPSRALPLQSIGAIQRERAAGVAARTVATTEEQQAKSLDLLAMNRGAKQLAALQRDHDARMKPIDASLQILSADRSKVLGVFYLGKALTAVNAVERSVLLEQAERYAQASGNAKLLDEIRAAKAKK